MAQYAKVVGGVVVGLVFPGRDPDVADRDDGPWIVTSYDGQTGWVELGWTYDDQTGEFTAPV